MSRAIVDDFVVTERTMLLRPVLIGAFALKVRDRECEQMTSSTLRAWGSGRHLNLVFTHSSRPTRVSPRGGLTLATR